MWDEVVIYFTDGTFTTIYVNEDDSIEDAIVEHVHEYEDLTSDDILRWEITDTIEDAA